MTNTKKLFELRDKAYEIARTNPTKIAIELKQEYQKEVDKIKRADMGPGERAYRMEQLPEKFGKELFAVLAEQKDQYLKYQKEARTLAQTLKLTAHAKPSDELAVKQFESELDALTVSTALAPNAGRSVDAITALLSKYSDVEHSEYYAQAFKEKFPQLMTNVLALESSPQVRHSLSKVMERIDAKATTEEQRAAVEVLEFFSNDNPKFYGEGLPAHTAISNVIGRKAAGFLNDPHKALEVIAEAEQPKADGTKVD